MKRIVAAIFFVAISSFWPVLHFEVWGQGIDSGVPGDARSNPRDIIIGNPEFGFNPGSGQIPGTRPIDYRQALVDEFGIVMNGFSQENMRWAWEFMHRVSNTRFPRLVEGTVVGVDNSGSWQKDCKTIFLRSTYPTYEQFAPVFAHELGHIVFHCSVGGGASARQRHLNALQAEGPLTPYSRELCYYTNPGATELETENFAEMIAYYLNPTSPAVTGCGPGPNPFVNGNSSAHFEVARSILEL